jgi:glycosyltransferase involved in cell wall biosynthesis
MNHPLVSVVMTAYNRASFIGAAIESVLAQTFTDFELIVVDDKSTDETLTTASRYASDSRVRLVAGELNRGDYPNRNYAATFARGEFLKYHDSDDIMYPHCLSVMVPALETEPRAQFALSGSRYWPGGPSPMLLTPRLAYQREFLGSGMFQFGPACALFRTEFFRSIGGFTLAGTASDYVFWAKACAHANVLLVAGDLFYYRVHAGQEMASASSVIDSARGKHHVWALLNSVECPLDEAEREQAKRNFMFTVVRDALYQLRAGRVQSALAFLRHTDLGPGVWLRYLRRPHRSTMAGSPVLSS